MASLEYHRAWRSRNRDKCREASRRYYQRHPGRDSNRVAAAIAAKRADPLTWVSVAIQDSRTRAKKLGLPHTIVASGVLLVTRCPVFGVSLAFGAGRPCPESPSLDRFVNALGYVPGNVRIISLRANKLKSDATAAELRALLSYVDG